MHDLDKYYAFASTLSSRGENSSSSSIWSWSWSWSVVDGPPKDTFVILKYFVDFGKKICPSRARAEQSLWGIWGFHLTKSCTKNPTHSFLITPTDTLIVVLVSCCAHCMCDSVCVSVCVCVCVSVWSKNPIHCSTDARAGEIGLTWRMSDLILNYGFWFLHSLLRSPLSVIDLRMPGDWRPD